VSHDANNKQARRYETDEYQRQIGNGFVIDSPLPTDKETMILRV